MRRHFRAGGSRPAKLDALLAGWDSQRRIAFCDEALAGASGPLPDMPGPWAILIGPEGGFSDAERRRLRGMDAAFAISLGPRILRADTAAVAALTLWQSRWETGDEPFRSTENPTSSRMWPSGDP